MRAPWGPKSLSHRISQVGEPVGNQLAAGRAHWAKTMPPTSSRRRDTDRKVAASVSCQQTTAAEYHNIRTHTCSNEERANRAGCRAPRGANGATPTHNRTKRQKKPRLPTGSKLQKRGTIGRIVPMPVPRDSNQPKPHAANAHSVIYGHNGLIRQPPEGVPPTDPLARPLPALPRKPCEHCDTTET